MPKKYVYWLSAIITLLTMTTAFAGSVVVNPIHLHISPRNHVAVLRLRNTSNNKMLFQVEVMRWQMRHKKDVLSNAPNMVATPPIFTIPVGKTQILRIGLLSSQPHSLEQTYRVIVRQIPTPNIGKLHNSLQLKFLLTFSIPLFELPIAPSRTLELRMDKTRHHDTRLMITNIGNVHIQLTKILLRDTEHHHIYTHKMFRYLLAHHKMQLILHLPKALQHQHTLQIVLYSNWPKAMASLPLDKTVIMHSKRQTA